MSKHNEKKLWHNDMLVFSDSRQRYYLNPASLIWKQQGSGEIREINSIFNDGNDLCYIKGSSDGTVGFVLDFGQELNGGVSIELGPASNIAPDWFANVRIRFGESVSEVMSDPNNDHAIHDVKLKVAAYGKHEFGSTGFRFVRIDFIDDSRVSIKHIKAVALEHPYEYKGGFDCSDPLLNEIWQTGARTVHLCCQEYILDGIKRDRMLWAGDLHPQIKVISKVFGNIDIVTKTLDKAYEMYGDEYWMNGYSSYSMWWIICVHDWFMFTGNINCLETYREPLVKLVKKVISHIDENGREKLSGQRFIDWVTSENKLAVDEGLQALTILCLQRAKNIFTFLNDQGSSNECDLAILRLKKVAPKQTSNKQVNALRVLAGLVDPAKANKESFTVDSLKGFSTWYGYYILQARAMAGDYSGALDCIKELWGGMIKLGATSFWEHFDVDWLDNAARIDELPSGNKCDVHSDYGEHCYKGLRHSLCHGWSGAVTDWLSSNVLGVSTVGPGFKNVMIKPNLMGLEYAKGTVPTPFGQIEVECKLKDGITQFEYELPDGVNLVDSSHKAKIEKVKANSILTSNSLKV